MTSRLDFYDETYSSMYPAMIAMSRKGIRVNRERMMERYKEISSELAKIRAEILAMAGESIFGPAGSISPERAAHFFYTTLGCNPVYKKKKGSKPKVTVDEFAVRKIRQRNLTRPKILKACNLILRFRFLDARKKFYRPAIIDKDDRIRASYGFTPPTLRFSSSKNPMGTGQNLQNPPRDGRDHFLPDKGHIMIAHDLSQAESRVVYMLTGEPDLMKLARLPPWEYDDHQAIADLIEDIIIENGLIDEHESDPKAVRKKKRYFGKQTNHGSNYGETGIAMAKFALKQGIVAGSDIFQKMINRKFEARPAILDVFQRGIRREILEDKILINAFGHELNFKYARMEPKSFRQGYMFKPQTIPPTIMNRFGWLPFEEAKVKWRWNARVANQIHDELLFSVHPNDAWELHSFMLQSLERPIMYADCSHRKKARELVIPATVKVGPNWGTMHEWDRPPSRKAFMEVVRAAAAGRSE